MKYLQVILPWLLCLWQGQLFAEVEIITLVTKQQANALKTINKEAKTHMATRKTLSYKIIELKDSNGQVYLGGVISKAELSPYLTQLEELLGEEFNAYRHNQALRDHHVFHVTLVNPIEYQTIPKNLLSKVATSKGQNYTLNLLGLGKVSSGNKTTYFVVGESSQGQFFRQQLLLKAKDFHVTLGFKPQDVYGVRKGKETLIY